MHHDSHILSANGFCETCGQPLPQPGDSYALWERKKEQTRRIGLGFTVALHLAFVLYYLFSPSPPPPKTTSAKRGGEMVYIAPLPITPQKPTVKPTPKKTEPKPTKPTKPAPSKPSTVRTKPTPQPKLETFVPPVQATMTPPPPPPPEQDMSAMLAKRRAEREAANPSPQPAEPAQSASERALARAKANIAGANARAGQDPNDSGGVFSVDKRSNSADVKFRGWNTNFKRNWLQQVHVEQGNEKDIETAVAKEMIKIIRKEKPGDFEWESRRLGRTVKMSARKEDEQELMAFLLKEMFPDYRP
ncbi:hypothetical protein ASF61_03150 [Duganella sp. Leaf126]|uniref:hypothetical protein n=1 Tax=Duganella sp. Leaf126 TaxID=1736266 RepID=UPI0006FE5352|nr:hypothetical protein [Duganella sp. Leaf126]KQQ47641.1 hypothetical protein ASF61_03150 [Duganella sp. Leaf126]